MPKRKAPGKRAKKDLSIDVIFQKEFGKQLEKLYRNIVKPIPIHLRIPLAVLGMAMLVGGFWVMVYFGGRPGFFIVGNRLIPAYTSFDYMGMFIGIVTLIAGYMIAHRALEGVWL